jgi:hypothetical protein
VAVAGVLLDQPIRPEAPTTGGPGAKQVEHLAQLLARQPTAD